MTFTCIIIIIRCIETINKRKFSKINISIIIFSSKFIIHLENNNRTSRRLRYSIFCSRSTSRLSNLTITLSIHINKFTSFNFNLLFKISKFSNILTHINIKHSDVLHLNTSSIFIIVYR